MPFLESREATLADLEVDHVTDAVTMPVFFLSQQGLIYVDIRAPNVLLTHDGQVRLIDYDDCAIVTVMPTTYVHLNSVWQMGVKQLRRYPKEELLCGQPWTLRTWTIYQS
jgi:Ser/Thr protein kinase RdoA (MazF antagonist)